VLTSLLCLELFLCIKLVFNEIDIAADAVLESLYYIKNKSVRMTILQLFPSNIVRVLSLYEHSHSITILRTWVVPGSSTRSTSGMVKPVSVIRLSPVPGLGAAVVAIESLEMGIARRAGRPAGRIGEGMKASALQYMTSRWWGGSGHKSGKGTGHERSGRLISQQYCEADACLCGSIHTTVLSTPFPIKIICLRPVSSMR